MNKVTVVVTFLNGEVTTIKEKPFISAMSLLWTSLLYKDLIPLKIKFPQTGKILYADRAAFNAFLNDDIGIKELLEITECDGLFRSLHEMKCKDEIIEAGSLWKRTNKSLELAENDYLYIADFEPDSFIEI